MESCRCGPECFGESGCSLTPGGREASEKFIASLLEEHEEFIEDVRSFGRIVAVARPLVEELARRSFNV